MSTSWRLPLLSQLDPLADDAPLDAFSQMQTITFSQPDTMDLLEARRTVSINLAQALQPLAALLSTLAMPSTPRSTPSYGVLISDVSTQFISHAPRAFPVSRPFSLLVADASSHLLSTPIPKQEINGSGRAESGAFWKDLSRQWKSTGRGSAKRRKL